MVPHMESGLWEPQARGGAARGGQGPGGRDGGRAALAEAEQETAAWSLTAGRAGSVGVRCKCDFSQWMDPSPSRCDCPRWGLRETQAGQVSLARGLSLTSRLEVCSFLVTHPISKL